MTASLHVKVSRPFSQCELNWIDLNWIQLIWFEFGWIESIKMELICFDLIRLESIWYVCVYVCTAETEADTFWCFTNLMSEIRDNFSKHLDHDNVFGIGQSIALCWVGFS